MQLFNDAAISTDAMLRIEHRPGLYVISEETFRTREEHESYGIGASFGGLFSSFARACEYLREVSFGPELFDALLWYRLGVARDRWEYWSDEVDVHLSHYEGVIEPAVIDGEFVE